MENGKVWVVLGGASISIPIMLLILILNWFLKITPFQEMQGLPILLPIFISPFGFLTGACVSYSGAKRLGRWSMVLNGALFILPFLYFILGTLIFGP